MAVDDDYENLRRATDGLAGQVENLQSALVGVGRVQEMAEANRQKSLELEARIVPKKEFDRVWNEAAGNLTRVAHSAKRWAVGSAVIGAVVIGSVGGYFINRQLDLNASKKATCESHDAQYQQNALKLHEAAAAERGEKRGDPLISHLLDSLANQQASLVTPCAG
jgi:hypothetical protein